MNRALWTDEGAKTLMWERLMLKQDYEARESGRHPQSLSVMETQAQGLEITIVPLAPPHTTPTRVPLTPTRRC